MKRQRVSVIGIGSPHGDDRLGWLALDALKQSARLAPLIPLRLRLEARDRPGMLLLSAWQGAGSVILIDAVCSGAEPGSVLRLSGADIGTPDNSVSTHGYGVAMAVALARALQQLPATLVLLGLEADPRSGGDALSPSLQVALPDFVRLIEHEVLMAAG
jgi:hydrogenase maturation protease